MPRPSETVEDELEDETDLTDKDKSDKQRKFYILELKSYSFVTPNIIKSFTKLLVEKFGSKYDEKMLKRFSLRRHIFRMCFYFAIFFS